MREFTVRGDDCVLMLRVFAYERPQLTSGADANWLQAEAELHSSCGGDFHARRRVSLRAEELAAFYEQLARLDETLNGEAMLAHMEEEVGCTIRLRAGSGELEAYVRDHTGAELRVNAHTDQSYLRLALQELDAVVASFPVKGEPFS